MNLACNISSEAKRRIVEWLCERTEYVPLNETEKITFKTSNMAEDLQLERVVQFFRPRSSCRTYLMLFSERPQIYALCMKISGGTTEQHILQVLDSWLQLIRIRGHSLSILTE